ncbi:MAG: YajQ family cyclic di-GMP-binding protein [Candidatus Nanopelagicales bacterium]
MVDFSFDIVSKADRMEVDNAVNQAVREIATRFDFKNTGAVIEYANDRIKVTADTEERCKAALDVVKDKWVKRQLSLKQLDTTEPQLSGKTYSIVATIKEGISSENAKKVSKLIRDDGPKSVKSQIQGDELRVSSKSKDDLQTTMALVKAADFDFAVQFTNFR